MFCTFYCIFMASLRQNALISYSFYRGPRISYTHVIPRKRFESEKSFWQFITVIQLRMKKCKNKLLMEELSLSFNFTRFVFFLYSQYRYSYLLDSLYGITYTFCVTGNKYMCVFSRNPSFPPPKAKT